MTRVGCCREAIRAVSLFVLVTLYCIPGASADPLLWRVESADSSSGATVYLFGSIHFGVAAMYPLPEAVEQAFDRSDYLAVELNVLTLDPAAASRAMLSKGLYADGGNLREALDEDTWRQLEAVAKQMGIPVQSFVPMRPWLVAIQLVSIQLQRAQFRQDLGVDRHFLQRADHTKAILELESLDSQLDSFARFSPEADALFLRQTLAEYSQGVTYLNALGEAWRRGDADRLSAIVFGGIDDSQAAQSIYQLLFVSRNHGMAAAVENYLREGKNVFLVAGVGHMLGVDGLVALLRKRGYRVEQR